MMCRTCSKEVEPAYTSSSQLCEDCTVQIWIRHKIEGNPVSYAHLQLSKKQIKAEA